MIEKVLWVDAGTPLRDDLVAVLGEMDAEMLEAKDATRALALVESHAPDLVVTGLSGEGRRTFDRLRADHPHVPVVLSCSHDALAQASELLRRGALGWIPEACPREVLHSLMQSLTRRLRLEHETALWRRSSTEGAERGELWIGESMLSNRLLEGARQIARAKTPLLITGETGAGKSCLAAYIHANGPRAEGPFLRVQCTAYPEPLLEREIFGHERSAVAGGRARIPGRLDLARGGTLVLDEVGELSLALQTRLLRLLEHESYERVGGTKTLRSDARLIATTNRSLPSLVRQGAYREDLVRRLSVQQIHVPPLRQRKDDIAVLARHFARCFAFDSGLPEPSLDEATLSVLEGQDWPGNVRELMSSVQQLVLRARAMQQDAEDLHLALLGDDLDPEARDAAGNLVGRPLEEIEREAILATLAATGWNKTEASRILGVTARTISNKIKIYRARGFVAR
ncbi:MAG: sigma-54-dependent Fis family transcriptional regulator [Planctomycetes bacterium]|nr:sigma-54-dependent Fis family transcriptional regulator [Planctomycetota bacterium]